MPAAARPHCILSARNLETLTIFSNFQPNRLCPGSTVDNLIWLSRARKNENRLLGPTVDEFCAGTCAYRPRLYGDPGPTKVLPGPTVP
jgi:hypothetical protein